MKMYNIGIGILVALLMISSASAAIDGINNNIVYRVDIAKAHADVWTDSSAPEASDVGEVTVVSKNGDATIQLKYKDPVDGQWWYTFDSDWISIPAEEMLKPYPLPKGAFVYGENTASVKAKQIPVRSTVDYSKIHYIDVSIDWAKQPDGIIDSSNGQPTDYGTVDVKSDYNFFGAVATGSYGAYDQVYAAQGLGPFNSGCFVTSTKKFYRTN